MPPDTMTLAGHGSDNTKEVSQRTNACQDPQADSLLATPTSLNTSTCSTASLFSSRFPCNSSASSSTGSVSCITSSLKPGPHSICHGHVPHCKQHFNWDCGLACVQMILQASGYPHCDYGVLRQFCATTSIWTVDLAHLLRRFGLAVAFYTITLGPNPAYAHESFYMEHMEDDERRVSQLFMEAGGAGIELQQRSVSGDELQAWMLSGRCLIIVLVDKRKLDPWLAAADMCLPALCGMELGYAGHYVLLVGFCAGSQEFIVRDPSSAVPDLRVSAAALDAARRSFGTDEDLLVVSNWGGGWTRRQAVEEHGSTMGAAAGVATGEGAGGGRERDGGSAAARDGPGGGVVPGVG